LQSNEKKTIRKKAKDRLRRNDPALIRRELALNKSGAGPIRVNPRQCLGLTIWSGSGEGGSRTGPTEVLRQRPIPQTVLVQMCALLRQSVQPQVCLCLSSRDS